MSQSTTILKGLRESTFLNEDGEEYNLEFKNGLTAQEIDELSLKFPNKKIPLDLLEILKETSGWEGYGIEQVDFTDIGEFGLLELSPCCITLGHDGFGNFWILDIHSHGTLGNIFYACHDPAVLVKYKGTLKEFLLSLEEFYKNPETNFLNKIHDEVVYDIWESQDHIKEKNVFLESNPELEELLSDLAGTDWLIADLRHAKNGEGFAWGKYGANSLYKRYENELIWAIKKKKQSLFRRILSN